MAALLSAFVATQAAPRTQFAVSTDGTRIAYDVTGSDTSAKANRPKLAGTKVKLVLLDGLTHPQEFAGIDQVFPAELKFTRALPRRGEVE